MKGVRTYRNHESFARWVFRIQFHVLMAAVPLIENSKFKIQSLNFKRKNYPLLKVMTQ